MVTTIPPPPNILQAVPEDLSQVAQVVQAQNRYIFELYKLLGPGGVFASAAVEASISMEPAM